MQSISNSTTKQFFAATKEEGQLSETVESSARRENKIDWSPEASPSSQRKQPPTVESKTPNGKKDGDTTVYDDFEKMGLDEKILRGVYAYGYEKPSAVQQRAIVPCTRGRDVVAQAQSGTGKTATFSIAILQQLDLSNNHIQVCTLTRN